MSSKIQNQELTHLPKPLLKEKGVKKRIVVIGGGTGTYTVLSGLKKHPDVSLTAIVSMADDGGSTGVLRTSLGVLPPGDIRRALVALSEVEAEESLLKLFNYRFPSEAVNGHSFGNLFLAALEKMLGSFDRAVEEASRILRVRGEVVPVTLDRVRLHARYENGHVVKGETNIDIPRHDPNLHIKEVWLDPQGTLNPKAQRAIQDADCIVIGPGDLYTSIVPNLLVSGMREALQESKALKVYIVNVMTKQGETHGFCVHDFVEVVASHVGTHTMSHVVFNTIFPSETHLESYRAEGADYVALDENELRLGPHAYIAEDVIAADTLIRHDADKLAKVLLSLI